MICLRASSISSVSGPVILGPSFVGFVHSVLDHQIIILSSHFCAISIEWMDAGKSPNGIAIEKPDDKSTFLNMGVAKGMECQRNGNTLYFFGSDCSISMEKVEPWNPSLIKCVSEEMFPKYLGNAEFLLNCLSIKISNYLRDLVGLEPIVFLANGDSGNIGLAVKPEWRLQFLFYLRKFIINIISGNTEKMVHSVTKILLIGEVTHTFLIGIFASLYAFGFSGTSSFNNKAIYEILHATGKQVFVSEVEAVMSFQGYFSEKVHKLLELILQGGETVQDLINNIDRFTIDCVLGMCVGIKALIKREDWLENIEQYTLSLESEERENNIRTSGEKKFTIPSIFRHDSSWRKMFNL